MKYIIIQFLFIVFLYANNDISDLISKINTAPQSQKRILINELKLRLRTLNQLKRKEVFNKLRINNHCNMKNINIKYNFHNQQIFNKNNNINNNAHSLNKFRGKKY